MSIHRASTLLVVSRLYIAITDTIFFDRRRARKLCAARCCGYFFYLFFRKYIHIYTLKCIIGMKCKYKVFGLKVMYVHLALTFD